MKKTATTAKPIEFKTKSYFREWVDQNEYWLYDLYMQAVVSQYKYGDKPAEEPMDFYRRYFKPNDITQKRNEPTS